MAGYPGTIRLELAARRQGRPAKRDILRRAGCLFAPAGSVYCQASGIFFSPPLPNTPTFSGQSGNSCESSEVRAFELPLHSARPSATWISGLSVSVWRKPDILHRSAISGTDPGSLSCRYGQPSFGHFRNFVIVDETDQPEVHRRSGFYKRALNGAPQSHIHARSASSTMSSGSSLSSAKLTFEGSKSIIHPGDPLYSGEELEVEEQAAIPGPALKAHGDVQVRSQWLGSRRLNFTRWKTSVRKSWSFPKTKCITDCVLDRSCRELLDSLPFTISERQDGLFGLLYALESVASLLLMCRQWTG